MLLNHFMQGRIQACFDSIQQLWVPKKTAHIFLQVQISNRIFAKMTEKINKEELSLLKHTKSLLKGTKFYCDA